MLVQIEPLDSLLFRDGRPFTAGTTHSAKSVFPPSPSVFAGFIRSKIFTDNWQGNENETWEKVKDKIGEKNNDFGKLKIKAICLKKKESDGFNYYFPSPLDICYEKRNDEQRQTYILCPDKLEISGISYKTNNPFNSEVLPFAPKEINFIETKSGFISKDNMEKYLRGENISKDDIKEIGYFVGSEPRTGIKVGSKYTVEEGYLYSVEFLRFKDSGFAVYMDNIDGINWNNEIYYMGGEKRQVKINTENAEISFNTESISEKIKNSKKFKILLLTPAYSKQIEPKKIKELFENKNIEAKLLSAVIKTEPFGGWDISNNCPKPTEKLISAGSVFYYELKEGEVNNLISMNFESISDKYDALGFGRILIGSL